MRIQCAFNLYVSMVYSNFAFQLNFINIITVCGEALVVVMSVWPSASTPCWMRNVPPLVCAN